MAYLLIDKIDQMMSENGFISGFILIGVPPKGKQSLGGFIMAPSGFFPP